MKISRANSSQGYVIQSYEAGQLVINQNTYSHSLILTPSQIRPDWRPQSMADLEPTDLDEVLSLQPGLIILGTGQKQIFPPVALQARPLEQGIGMEIMDTPAACRTYNILMAEGRAVAVALMMI